MENKRKHLEMIQDVITRMAKNSFLLKGWSVTLTAAIFALAGNKDSPVVLPLIALLPIIMFWYLDGYFLHQERLFRKLYDHVRELPESEVDFSMDTSPFPGSVDTLSQVIRSNTLKLFHLPIAVLSLVVFILLLICR